jgi:receptor protein-tyrosine kinase
MTSIRTGHLVERAAALLRSSAGFAPEAASDLAVPIAAGGAAEPVALPALLAIPPPPGPARLDMPTLRQAGLVFTSHQRTRISEEYRIAVARILRDLRGAQTRTEPGNLLMVTSARPGEGKTFTALNIAACIAQSGLGEALLVDMDATLRSLSVMLGQSSMPGIYDLAGNPALRIEDMLVRTAIGGLSCLPVGATEAEPGVSRPVSAIIERLRRRFPHHFILLDCAPCLSNSDPSTLAGLADQVILVVEAERTQRSELETSLELLQTCPNIMLLLNKVQLSTNYTFGAYHHYGSQP